MDNHQEIIKILLNGITTKEDERHISYLYRKILPKIEHYIRKNGGSKEEAEDLFQDAVITMVKRIRENKFRDDTELDGFLFSVARNLWIDKKRRIGTETKYLDYSIATDKRYEDLNDTLVLKEKQEAFLTVFSKVGKKCKELLKYSVLEKISMKEISVKLGFKNEQVAKAANYRCKKELAQLVKNDSTLLELYTS